MISFKWVNIPCANCKDLEETHIESKCLFAATIYQPFTPEQLHPEGMRIINRLPTVVTRHVVDVEISFPPLKATRDNSPVMTSGDDAYWYVIARYRTNVMTGWDTRGDFIYKDFLATPARVIDEAVVE